MLLMLMLMFTVTTTVPLGANANAAPDVTTLRSGGRLVSAGETSDCQQLFNPTNLIHYSQLWNICLFRHQSKLVRT